MSLKYRLLFLVPLITLGVLILCFGYSHIIVNASNWIFDTQFIRQFLCNYINYKASGCLSSYDKYFMSVHSYDMYYVVKSVHILPSFIQVITCSVMVVSLPMLPAYVLGNYFVNEYVNPNIGLFNILALLVFVVSVFVFVSIIIIATKLLSNGTAEQDLENGTN
ncbi:hypothetical protein Catovirus_1_439 [Catovirus CTV1]|uniref:Uncharacterized protein n=1 Tax=Catovirus CTV1 TaxID=1977631 RepID=A0A1V0S9M1_9VIRU|nr:hypothetical protein Catovirus_1_439 [Catovirus CTV1]